MGSVSPGPSRWEEASRGGVVTTEGDCHGTPVLQRTLSLPCRSWTYRIRGRVGTDPSTAGRQREGQSRGVSGAVITRIPRVEITRVRLGGRGPGSTRVVTHSTARQRALPTVLMVERTDEDVYEVRALTGGFRPVLRQSRCPARNGWGPNVCAPFPIDAPHAKPRSFRPSAGYGFSPGAAPAGSYPIVPPLAPPSLPPSRRTLSRTRFDCYPSGLPVTATEGERPHPSCSHYVSSHRQSLWESAGGPKLHRARPDRRRRGSPDHETPRRSLTARGSASINRSGPWAGMWRPIVRRSTARSIGRTPPP